MFCLLTRCISSSSFISPGFFLLLLCACIIHFLYMSVCISADTSTLSILTSGISIAVSYTYLSRSLIFVISFQSRPPRAMNVISRLIIIFTLLFGTACAFDGDTNCGVEVACFPWAGGNGDGAVSCTRDQRMNLRFMLDIADENVAASGLMDMYTVYGFCPFVDKIEALFLRGAPSLASVYVDAGVKKFTKNIGTKYLSVYGFGRSDNALIPDRKTSSGSVMVAESGDSLCDSQDSVALVHTLVLDTGLHMGLFHYIDAQESLNEKGTTKGGDEKSNSLNLTSHFLSGEGGSAVQPAMVGFRPTCNANDECPYDANSVCVGEKTGSKNCATCYSAPDDVQKAQLRVWVSYHGTDNKRRPLHSGGLNPLKFDRFSSNRLYTTVANFFDELKAKVVDVFQ